MQIHDQVAFSPWKCASVTDLISTYPHAQVV